MIPTPIKLLFITLFGILGVWLIYWDVVDYLTKGLNTGVWDFAIIQQGFPSIFTGFAIVLVCAFLGVRVLKT